MNHEIEYYLLKKLKIKTYVRRWCRIYAFLQHHPLQLWALHGGYSIQDFLMNWSEDSWVRKRLICKKKLVGGGKKRSCKKILSHRVKQLSQAITKLHRYYCCKRVCLIVNFHHWLRNSCGSSVGGLGRYSPEYNEIKRRAWAQPSSWATHGYHTPRSDSLEQMYGQKHWECGNHLHFHPQIWGLQQDWELLTYRMHVSNFLVGLRAAIVRPARGLQRRTHLSVSGQINQLTANTNLLFTLVTWSSSIGVGCLGMW